MSLFFLPAIVILSSPQEADDRKGDQPLEDQKKLQSLLRELEKAREEGQPDREEKISREIRRIEESRSSRQDREGDDRSSEELIDRIAQLRKDAIRAKREGDADRAKEAWSEADKLEGELRGQMRDNKGRSARGDRRDPKTEDVLREIKEKARAVAQEGKAKAKEFEAKAKELAAKAKALDKSGQEVEADAVRREAEEVRTKAEIIARDYQEKAEKLRRDAEDKAHALLERSRNDARNGKGPRPDEAPAKPTAPRAPKGPVGVVPPQPPGVPPPPNGFNGDERDDLRQEIDRLLSEVRDL